MRHGIVREGLRFRLRPMNVSDAEFMLDLRHRDGIREHVNRTSHSIGDQRVWIVHCLDCASDHSFVLEDIRSGRRAGSFSVYDRDDLRRRARIGRWLVLPGSRSVPEFAMLGYGVCFEVLRLDSVFSRIPHDNVAALAFQKRIKSTPLGAVANVELNGRAVALLEFELQSAAWPNVQDALQAFTATCYQHLERRKAKDHASDKPSALPLGTSAVCGQSGRSVGRLARGPQPVNPSPRH